MEERRTRTERKKKKNNTGKLILLWFIAVAIFLGIFFACRAINKENPMPIVYEKGGMLMVKNDREDEPFLVTKNYAGGPTALIQDGDGLVFTDSTGALCYSNIKTAESATKLTVLSDDVFQFLAVDESHIYYIKNKVLYRNNLKGESEVANGVLEIVATEDGRFVFFNTETDLFGINVEKKGSPIRIAENVTVYNILHTAEDWKLDSENLYYLAESGKFARLNEDLTETVLCENASIAFVMDGSVFAVTKTQIGEAEYKRDLYLYKDTPTLIVENIAGEEAVPQIYNEKTYMLFTKYSEADPSKEQWYTLDKKGNFRYLCNNENYQNLFTDVEGKKAYIHTESGDVIEYKLTGKAELKTKTKKIIASGAQKVYLVNDHIGISSDKEFGIYHNGKYEAIYNDGKPHYPKLLVFEGKAYICDQSGAAPFYICKGGKLREADKDVVSYNIISDTRVAYLKSNASGGLTWDLYKIDNNKEPQLIDTDITALH